MIQKAEFLAVKACPAPKGGLLGSVWKQRMADCWLQPLYSSLRTFPCHFSYSCFTRLRKRLTQNFYRFELFVLYSVGLYLTVS